MISNIFVFNCFFFLLNFSLLNFFLFIVIFIKTHFAFPYIQQLILKHKFRTKYHFYQRNFDPKDVANQLFVLLCYFFRNIKFIVLYKLFFIEKSSFFLSNSIFRVILKPTHFIFNSPKKCFCLYLGFNVSLDSCRNSFNFSYIPITK